MRSQDSIPPGRALCLILGRKALQDSTVREALDAIRAEGHLVEIREIEHAGQGRELARQAARGGQFDTLVAVGGDGTLHQVINGLFDVDSPRWISAATVPFGTGNDFASASGIPADDPLAALRLAAEGAPSWIDVGRANGTYFINAATAGAAADVTAEAPDAWKQVLGKFSYFLSGLNRAARAEATPVRLQGPDFRWEGSALTLVIANGRQAGGGVQVAPQARLNDGMLDLLVIPDMSLVELTPVVLDLLSEQPQLEDSRIVYRQLPWLDVQADSPLRVNLDGEPAQGTEFHFEITADRLLFHLPQGAEILQPVVRAETANP